MIIKLTAEFDSVDTAEFAAKDIKNKVTNISTITIKQKQVDDNSDNHAEVRFIPYYVHNTSINAVPLIRVDNADIDRNPPPCQAILEVICDIKSQNLVNQIMLTYGGLKINK